jgi:hypothetical protein
MLSSGMLRRVAFVRTAHIASIIRVTGTGELETALAVTSNRSTLRSSSIFVTLMKEAIRSSEKSVLKRATRLHIPEDDILYSHAMKTSTLT